VSILKRLATPLSDLRWGFEMASKQLAGFRRIPAVAGLHFEIYFKLLCFMASI
jgi:hypothetical protein